MDKFKLSNVKNTIALSRFFLDNKVNFFTFPIKEQKSFIEKLGKAGNDYERSYKQYLCQRQMQKKGHAIFIDMLFYIVYPFLLLFACLKGIFLKKKYCEFDAIAATDLTELLPDELLLRYKITEELYYKNFALSIKDVLFSLKLFSKYPLRPFFVTKITLKIAYYSYMIRSYSPKAILVMNEYSFTSSILTKYCEKYNVRHIDALHGEKLYYIGDSYFRYHECWVWHEHYKKLLTDLNAEPNQFRIAVPKSLRVECDKFINNSAYADYKYYLQIYTEKQIEELVKSMKFAINQGKIVKYRPHPIWSDLDLLKKYVPETSIEDTKTVSIFESIANVKVAVGSYSSVLNQAYFSGKEVILDDVAFKDQYDKIKEMKYFLNEIGMPRLSDYTSRS